MNGACCEPGVKTLRALMLVSDWVDNALRADVAAGRRPCPEYLYLERDHGVEIFDWSRLGGTRRGRSVGQSLHHVAVALQRVRDFDVVFSDGEHLGIPLALAMRASRVTRPHLVIGHHLTTRAKRLLFRLLRWERPMTQMTRILVHSRQQLERARQQLRVAPQQVAFVPYSVDVEFWQPLPTTEESLIVSAGQDHRDYLTLAQACGGLGERVFVARGSRHSPRASARMPDSWPDNFETGFVDYQALRSWYARAQVVAIPLVPTDFQAGVTTLLESMAMGKATVVSGTNGQADIVEDGVSGILVAPGDAGDLRRAVRYLIQHPRDRARLARNARGAVCAAYDLRRYAASLAQHLNELAGALTPVRERAWL